MGKRKKALKKKCPERHKIIKILREGNYIKEIIDENGKPICLNLMKHLLYQRPYAKGEYNREVLRFAKGNKEILGRLQNDRV